MRKLLNKIRKFYLVAFKTKYILHTVHKIDPVPDKNTYQSIATIIQVDDEKMVIDKTLSRKISLFPAVFFTFGSCFGSYGLISEIAIKLNDVGYCIFISLLMLPLICLSSYAAAHFIYNPIRKITFNRLKGTVDVPAPWIKGWSGKTIQLKFDEMNILPDGIGSRVLVIQYPNNKYFTTNLIPVNYHKELAFIIWYMDKNRQLPPGSILDAYRVKDYLRREAEGFPLPLFSACSNRLPDRKEKPQELLND